MVQPSPCPRCGGTRSWKLAGAEAATVPVLCGACGREATACPRCGWEWTGLPRSARVEHRASCVSCRVLRISQEREVVGRGGEDVTEKVPTAFTGRSTRSRLLQRLADAGEADGEKRYRACRSFAEVVAEASRRAEAIARLEAGLRRLPVPVR